MFNSGLNPKIKTLVTDLKSLSIGKYLKTTEFERNCINIGIENLWHQAYERAKNDRNWFSMNTDHQKYDCEEAMSFILNHLYQRDKVTLSNFLLNMLTGFIEWSNKLVDFKSVFEDLVLIDFQKEKLVDLKGVLEKKQVEWDKNEKQVKEKEVKKIKETSLNNYPPENLKMNKKKWIKLIAESKLEEVIDEVFEFSEEIEDYHILKDVVIQSSRMSELKMQFNQNVLSDENYRIEKNKIISALIDMINKIK